MSSTKVILNLSSIVLCGSNDEINVPHTLLLTERQASATDAATQNKIYRSGLTNTDNLK